jgi:hypothetical protein
MIKKFSQKVNENKSESDKGMVLAQLDIIRENIDQISHSIKELESDELPAWVQDKISVSNHNMDAITTWLKTLKEQ